MPTPGLNEAIVAWLDAYAPLRALMPDGIWSDEAAEGTPLPYLILIEIAGDRDYETPDENSAVNFIEANQYQISVFASTKEQSQAIGHSVAMTLSAANLTFNNGNLLLLRISPRHSEMDPQPGPDGSNVWQMILVFDAIIESNLSL